MANKTTYRTHGALGSFVFHAILLLLCLYLGLTTSPMQEEGLLVNFGDTETGSGLEEPMQNEAAMVPESPAPSEVPSIPPSPVTQSEPEEEKINTQNFEEAAAVKEAAEKAKKIEEQKRLEEKRLRDEQMLAEKKAREERERIQKEELEKKRRAEEQARKAQEARENIAKGFAGKGTGSNASEGVAGGEGNQGKITGDPNSSNRVGTGLGSQGNSFDLSGRSLVGVLPKPAYTIQEEGVVVVEIQVDRYGKVTGASVRSKGTTIQNSVLWNVAKEAAMKARFNENTSSPTVQTGTITYHFKMQ